MTETVGLIGLGLLGSALADRLRSSGFEVMGWDTNDICLDRLQAAGGLPAGDLPDLASRCRRILLSLPTSDVSRTVTSELTAHCSPGTVIIDTTTGDPAVMVAIGDNLEAAGIGYLDATIAGSSTQVRAGDVMVLAGGDKAHVAACSDIFESLSRTVIPVGPRGSGARMKLVVNLVLGLNRAVLAEGLSFAKSLGFDPQAVLDVLSQSPAASAVMTTKGAKMVTSDFTPQARLRQHLKDVRLILDVSKTARTPLSEVHAELLQSLVDRGFGDEDNSAIIRAFDNCEPPT